MIIDVHVHPVLFGPICTDSDRVNFRKKAFGLYKSSPVPMEQVMAVMDHAGVDRAVILAEDYSASMGQPIVSNEEVKRIVELFPERFIGFASVDPREECAAEKLKDAFEKLNLMGLKLNLSHLNMYPDDRRLKPLLDLCTMYDKPVLFHSGFSWEPDSPSKYTRPILFEDIAVEYPTLRFCLSHLGWPWVDELCMLLLKYPNVYTDTATVFMDSPKNYYEQIFLKNMAPGWLQNNLMDNEIASRQEFEMVKITDQVQKDVAASGITAGVVFVISMHTTTAIMINESLPCVEKDIELTLERLIPTDGDYVHTHMLPSYGTCSGNAPGHLKSMLCGNHCVLPVIDGKVAGGSAQDIYFVEFDGLKIRKYTVQILGE